MKKVVELVRVSTAEQAAEDRASIPAQHAVNRKTARQHGLDIVRTVEITDVSGTSVLLSPEMQGLIKTIQNAEIHGVVAREFSRLMRPENFEDYALLQAFADSATILYLPEGPIDFTNKSGRLMGTIRAAIAGMERTENLERVWTAKEEKRRRGELAQSKIVLPKFVGYEPPPGRGFFYELESEKVREAFRQFLSGNQSYVALSKVLSVTPRGAHLILRNPIWTGWRVIDKKRDTSSAGKYASKNGRQTDRRKIRRAPEDVIRIQVIHEPLIAQADFDAVQKIMDRKQLRHWRSRPGYEHRFTYRGYLTCSECGEIIHTAHARRDYYACAGRRRDHKCHSKYMAREPLETILDEIFADRLLDPSFIAQCIAELRRRAEQDGSALRINRLNSQVNVLRNKRDRVIELFIDGLIDREERDGRLRAIDRDIQTAQDTLMRETPAALDSQAVVKALSPLREWRHWSPEQKRKILSTIVSDIRVADYKVTSVGLNAALLWSSPQPQSVTDVVSNELTRKGTDSLRQRA